MLVVHHLNDSRSQRILWLLEELGAPYEIKFYQRDATTRLAPPELKAVNQLGKSPVVAARCRRSRSSWTITSAAGAPATVAVFSTARTLGGGVSTMEPGRRYRCWVRR